MGACIGGAVGGGVGPGGKGPETDDSAAILKIKENKPTTKMKAAIHPVPYYVPDASYFGVLVIEGQMNNVLLLALPFSLVFGWRITIQISTA
jgi:hypothetical protein